MRQKALKTFGNKSHKIIMGDALIAMQSISDETVDLIFIDPPYNIGKDFNSFKDKWNDAQSYIDWCFKWLALALKKLKPSGSLYLGLYSIYALF